MVFSISPTTSDTITVISKNSKCNMKERIDYLPGVDVAQIVLIILDARGLNLNNSVTTLYQFIRILRILRFVSLMQRLYATAVAAGGTILPALNLKPQYAYFINLIYGGLAILSFLSCLVYAPRFPRR